MLVHQPVEHVIYRTPIAEGATADIVRDAVRAVILSDGKILMIYSEVNEDYKFPGGGIEIGETHHQTLIREVREECGCQVESVGKQFARIREFGEAMEPDAEVFRMDSHYYFASVKADTTEDQRLDDYERRLRFVPRWVTIEEAIANNQDLMDQCDTPPRWTPRETWLLRQLQEHITQS